jgi:hypothetical protein
MIDTICIAGVACTIVAAFGCISVWEDDTRKTAWKIWIVFVLLGCIMFTYGIILDFSDSRFKTNIQYNMGVCPLCASKWVLIDTITRQKEFDVALYSCGKHLLMLDDSSTPSSISLEEKNNPKNKEFIDEALNEILVLPESNPVIEQEN